MVERFRSLAEAQSVTLKVEVPITTLQVHADPDRLQQILHNLLGNALRHTPGGGSIRLSAETTADHLIRFRVQDTGVGIAPADLPYIFERFYRGDKSRARSNDYTSGYTKWKRTGVSHCQVLGRGTWWASRRRE